MALECALLYPTSMSRDKKKTTKLPVKSKKLRQLTPDETKGAVGGNMSIRITSGTWLDGEEQA